jgi:hypothetical protein
MGSLWAGRLFYAADMDGALWPAMLMEDSELPMNDVVFVGIFFACLLATVALARLCDRLKPRDARRKP